MDLQPSAKEIADDDLPYMDIVLSVCHGLLVQEKMGRARDRIIIRPVHYTATEYLSRTYTTYFPDGQSKVAKACVTYLSFQPLADHLSVYLGWLQREDRGSREREIDLEAAFTAMKRYEYLQNHFCLFLYAAKHWADHTRQTFLSGSPIPLEELFWGYGKENFRWNELLYIGKVRSHDSSVWEIFYGAAFESYRSLALLLRTLTDNGTDLNAPRETGQLLLFQALKVQHAAAAKFLLSRVDKEIVDLVLKESNRTLAELDETFAELDRRNFEDILKNLQVSPADRLASELFEKMEMSSTSLQLRRILLDMGTLMCEKSYEDAGIKYDFRKI